MNQRISDLSIIVTYYKGEGYIFNCIDSLLNSYEHSQKKISFEIIIVIDSMEDAETIEDTLVNKYKSYPVTIKKNSRNIGVSNSRNGGLEISKYKFYTIIDQDDFVKEKYFSVIEGELLSEAPLYILNGTVLFADTNIEIPIYTFSPRFTLKQVILKKTIIYTPGLLILNADYFSKTNFFIDTSQKYKGCDDWAAYLNLLIKSNGNVSYKFIDELLFVYCLHSKNYSNNKEELIRSSIAVLEHFAKTDNLSETKRQYISLSRKIQEFDYAKEVVKSKPATLFFKYPSNFLMHYVFSFFNRDRMNRIIFKIKYLYFSSFRNTKLKNR